MTRLLSPMSWCVVAALSLAPACGDDNDAADTTVATDTANDIGDVADTTPPATCGTESPAALAACVDSTRIEADIRALALTPRATGTVTHAQAQETLRTRLSDMGYTVEMDTFGRGTNVIGVRTGTTSPNDLVVISAHYDTIPGCEGADDNASGVAGALEAARVLATTEHDRTVVIAFWDEEERGKIGAAAWVDKTVRENKRVVISYVFEMIAYRSTEVDSQMFPPAFGVLFPEVQATLVESGSKGDFIALIVGDDALDYSDAMVAVGGGIGLPVVPVVLDAAFRKASALGDLRRSDHHAFWNRGWPSMMITDTANFRNPNYHCGDGPDLPGDLDFDFAADVVTVTVNSATVALSDTAPTAGKPANVAPCDLIMDGCDAGESCALSADASFWFSLECIAVPTVTVGLGETCERPNNTVGEDTCEAGKFCAFWGLPRTDPQLRQCLAHCTSVDDCEAGQQCQAIDLSYPRGGLCTTVCDPFDTNSCPADTNCHGERSRVDGTPSWLCGRIGEGAVGSACRPTRDECGLGLGCAYDPADGAGSCGVRCDDDHPCDEGTVCVRRFHNPDDSSRGICR
ncbi:MAG: hypothetical protein ACI9MR_002375 [Myxococcota bacterium]|jgi:hypothetical protein